MIQAPGSSLSIQPQPPPFLHLSSTSKLTFCPYAPVGRKTFSHSTFTDVAAIPDFLASHWIRIPFPMCYGLKAMFHILMWALKSQSLGFFSNCPQYNLIIPNFLNISYSWNFFVVVLFYLSYILNLGHIISCSSICSQHWWGLSGGYHVTLVSHIP